MVSKCDKYKLTKYLVIVESPAKCSTIEKYLGASYKCIATYGHFRTIATLKDIDINHVDGLKINYTLIEDSYKSSAIKRLKEEINAADEVLLATDDDREGEAIAWHICDFFKLPIIFTKRIIFHEITEQAIVHAAMHPTVINMNTVRSQQARQVLDLIVGFNISPVLWKLVQNSKTNSLSAGRCQTPALQLVYDNFKEFQQSKGRKVYNTTGTFTNLFLPFSLNKEFETELDAEYFLENDASHAHVFNKGINKVLSRAPPKPFTTSGLQQTSSYSPKETMSLCQSLYEKGLITYMRTDSTKYSAEFVDSCKLFIINTYLTPAYLSPNIDAYVVGTTTSLDKNKNNNKNKKTNNLAQEAHEAIRPTDINRSNINTVTGVSAKEIKMYSLIWSNSLKSLMSDATFSSFSSTISAFDSLFYKYTCEQIMFMGWMIVQQDRSSKDVSDVSDNGYTYLSTIKQCAILEYSKIEAKQTILGLKQRYTESKLVSLLEENGIGRPSTYASLVDKIQERNYVKKEDVAGTLVRFTDFELEGDNLSEITRERLVGTEKNKLVIQPLGIIVIELLLKHFSNLFNYDYTREMEQDLDAIAKGETGEDMCRLLCGRCQTEVMESVRITKTTEKVSYAIDENHSYIIGKNGPVIKKVENGVTTFLPVIKNIDINKLEKGEYSLQDVTETVCVNSVLLGKYKGDDLFVKKGKFGLYATYGENRLSLQMFGNRPVENITFVEVFGILEDEGLLKPTYNKDQKALKIVRELSASITIRKGKWGNYIFYQTTQMQKPSFYDLKTFEKDTKQKVDKCDINIVKNWIKTTYNIS